MPSQGLILGEAAKFLAATGLLACLTLGGLRLPAAEPHRALGDLQLKPGDYVAVVGDSITEQREYSVMVEAYLMMCKPVEGLRVGQFGWSGQTARGFADRIDRDLLPFRPNVVTTCFGMNDGGYEALTPERAEGYQRAERAIVRSCTQAGVRAVILGSPGCVDANTYKGNPAEARVYNRALAQERDLARDVASAEGVGFADVHEAMFSSMTIAKGKWGSAYPVGGQDGVHPGRNGHLCMAYAFLRAMGCSGEVARLEVDLATGRMGTSKGHRLLGRRRSCFWLESTRYPFCFTGDLQAPHNFLEVLPFNEHLNRFILVARHGNAERWRVTWGGQARTFTAAQLAAGINLAEAFPDNPFAGPFARVVARIQAQQAFETTMIKSFQHTLGEVQKAVPEAAPAWLRVHAGLVAADRLLFTQAQAMVRPVRHTLKLEAQP